MFTHTDSFPRALRQVPDAFNPSLYKELISLLQKSIPSSLLA